MNATFSFVDIMENPCYDDHDFENKVGIVSAPNKKLEDFLPNLYIYTFFQVLIEIDLHVDFNS